MALRAVTSNGVAITPSSLTVSGTLTGSSGTATAASISPTINQSGTAGYTAFDINPTETATGSGTKLLQRWAVGGTAVAQLYNNGVFYAGFVVGANRLGLSSTIGGTADIELNRDAADALALRRGTNAQTFRVYNTYTDASNYARLNISATSSNTDITTSAAGTGSIRALRLYTEGNANVEFGTSSVIRAYFNSSGHFLMNADNSYDIGASGASRPRHVYVGTNITAGNAINGTYFGLGTAAASSTFALFAASTTATSHARFTAGVAPTTPVDGDFWFDGADFKARVGGVTKTFTIV